MTSALRPTGWAVVAALIVSLGFGQADEKPQPKPAEPPKKLSVMQRKLGHSQKVLEALALNDFERIKAEAASLQLCAKEASWQVLKTQKYEIYSNDFVRNLDNLQAAAKKKNIDSAALAYVEITLTCVKCHQYVREEGIGAAPDLSPLTPRTAAGR